MFSVTVSDHVMVAHSLPDPFFGPAQGLHGVTYVVEATWRRRELDEHGVVIDIGAATGALREVLDELDYRNLDDLEAFSGRVTTTEVVAQHIAERLVRILHGRSQDSGGSHTGVSSASRESAGFVDLGVVLREHPRAWAGFVHAFADGADGR